MVFEKGHTPWNKGLTKRNPRVASWSAKVAESRRRLYATGKLVPWNKKRISKAELERRYWVEGKSIREVAEDLGWNKSTVLRWMKRYGIDRRPRYYKIRKFALERRIKPELKPSSSLFYIVGVLLGDGNVWSNEEKQRHRVRLKVTDKPFAQSFANALKHIGLHPRINEGWEDSNFGRSYFYVTSAHSAIFCRWFKELSLDDIKNMVLSTKNKELFLAFIRGFYESEGSCNPHHSYYEARMYNSNKKLLEMVHSLLQKLGFHPFLSRVKSEKHYVSIYRKNDVFSFLREVNPCVKLPKNKGG